MIDETPLRKFLSDRSLTAEEFASQHGFSAWSVRHWARGDKHPELESQIKLGGATDGIAGPEAWLTWVLANTPAPVSPQASAA